MNGRRQAQKKRWFIVFDTLTLADDRLDAYYDNPNSLRDYFRDIGRIVLAAEGRKANDSHADCYQYFCVPEYGTANGRLHFFFSSRRRHTTFGCDWSSDVCSSDLPARSNTLRLPRRRHGTKTFWLYSRCSPATDIISGPSRHRAIRTTAHGAACRWSSAVR